MEVAIDATIQLIEAALEVLPDEPEKNLNRPHVNSQHLTAWPNQSSKPWLENL